MHKVTSQIFLEADEYFRLLEIASAFVLELSVLRDLLLIRLCFLKSLARIHVSDEDVFDRFSKQRNCFKWSSHYELKERLIEVSDRI